MDQLLLPHQSADIREASTDTMGHSPFVYDLQGRKVQSTAKKKDIYIFGNKKILIK
jgi:hypothetical protein